MLMCAVIITVISQLRTTNHPRRVIGKGRQARRMSRSRFSFAPGEAPGGPHRNLPDTAILVTRFMTPDGVGDVHDRPGSV
jgi:hypothetical protein